LDDLIRRDSREVSIEVLSNAELYQWELENLFAMGWNLVGHESEIPDPNDYMVRPMGEDQVLVARDRQGRSTSPSMSAPTGACVWPSGRRATRRCTNVSTTAGRFARTGISSARRWKRNRCTAISAPRRNSASRRPKPISTAA